MIKIKNEIKDIKGQVLKVGDIMMLPVSTNWGNDAMFEIRYVTGIILDPIFAPMIKYRSLSRNTIEHIETLSTTSPFWIIDHNNIATSSAFVNKIKKFINIILEEERTKVS